MKAHAIHARTRMKHPFTPLRRSAARNPFKRHRSQSTGPKRFVTRMIGALRDRAPGRGAGGRPAARGR